MDPVLGGEVVEGEQHVEVVSDLGRGLRPLRPELVVEGLGGVSRMIAVLGVADLAQHLSRERLDRLRQRIKDVRRFVHPTPLLFGFGKDLPQRRPEPERTVSCRDDRVPHAPVAEVA